MLLIIFEARPDALPQIASLAIRSGNGLLLKVWVGAGGGLGLLRRDASLALAPPIRCTVVGLPLPLTHPPPAPACAAVQGGKEATRSNALLHQLIVDAVAEVAPGVGRDLIGLVTSRHEIDELLKLHDVIDLVIPRGSNQLVGCGVAAGRGRMGGGQGGKGRVRGMRAGRASRGAGRGAGRRAQEGAADA